MARSRRNRNDCINAITKAERSLPIWGQVLGTDQWRGACVLTPISKERLSSPARVRHLEGRVHRRSLSVETGPHGSVVTTCCALRDSRQPPRLVSVGRGGAS